MDNGYNNNSYQNSSFGMMPDEKPNGHAKGYAIASLCLGIASVFCTCVCCCLFYVSIVTGIISIVMAILAKKDNGGKMPGMAITGLILAIIGIIGFILMLIIEIGIGSTNPNELLSKINEFYKKYTGIDLEEIISSIDTSALE